MNLPELEEQLSMFTTTWIDWRNSHEKYGESCYAKGRADLLKEIGDPVAWLHEIDSFDGQGYSCFKTVACRHPKPVFIDGHEVTEIIESKPLYVLPKEKP